MEEEQRKTNSESEIEIIEITPRKKKNTQKPNWFVCFFKAFAYHSFGGFINLFTGENRENRFLRFIYNIFILIMNSLPVALFVSYFLITLPTWIFVLAVLMIACYLVPIVNLTKKIYSDGSKKQPKEEPKKQEQANNHAKFYAYDYKFYKNKPTTLIGDFFRFIGDVHFTFLTGKDFMSGTKSKRSEAAKNNIICIIYTLCFWPVVVLCFLMTVPKWLFVLAIVAAVSRFVNIFCCAYLTRQGRLRPDLYFCKCKMEGENEWHASFQQVDQENRYDGIPECEYIDKDDVKDCCDISSSSDD